ncbi:MAG: DUF1311 domain-containing protein [Betaproteobacteria bacterium]|nr:DUF1311 domain-containing protein [Betaproteobacteria bacterium]
MRPSTIIAIVLMLEVTDTAASANCGELQTQVEMNQCASHDYAKADRELTMLYNEYWARLSEDRKRQLRDAQLAWLKFRDLSCSFESSGVRGGSVYPLMLNTCLATMTRARLQQLTVLANCKEGDLSCTVWE